VFTMCLLYAALTFCNQNWTVRTARSDVGVHDPMMQGLF